MVNFAILFQVILMYVFNLWSTHYRAILSHHKVYKHPSISLNTYGNKIVIASLVFKRAYLLPCSVRR